MKAFLDIAELQGTAGHLGVLQAKLDALESRVDRLRGARRDSWSQLLVQLARLYAAGRLTIEELYELQQEMARSHGPGHSKLWDAHMPIESRQLGYTVARMRRVVPNGPNGSWHGTFPMTPAHPRPPDGQAVVYVLFDSSNQPVYVGSTDVFRSRMAPHVREKPGLAYWVAYPCRDRRHAYEVEDQVLRQHLPHLNRKASR